MLLGSLLLVGALLGPDLAAFNRGSTRAAVAVAGVAVLALACAFPTLFGG